MRNVNAGMVRDRRARGGESTRPAHLNDLPRPTSNSAPHDLVGHPDPGLHTPPLGQRRDEHQPAPAFAVRLPQHRAARSARRRPPRVRRRRAAPAVRGSCAPARSRAVRRSRPARPRPGSRLRWPHCRKRIPTRPSGRDQPLREPGASRRAAEELRERTYGDRFLGPDVSLHGPTVPGLMGVDQRRQSYAGFCRSSRRGSRVWRPGSASGRSWRSRRSVLIRSRTGSCRGCSRQRGTHALSSTNACPC